MPTRTRPAHIRTIAPLVWGTLTGPRLTDADRRLLAAGLGGVVLFARNVADPDQVAALVADARRAAAGPLRVAVDQEGGHIVRLGEPLTRFPGPMALAATGDPSLAASVARASGAELAALGIDVVLAPDLDLALARTNPALGARTFGDDPRAVGRFGSAMIAGYVAGGVLPVAKHFPGHGRPDSDSHVADPVVEADLATLLASDLVPFAAAIDAGVPALMLGHVRYDALAAQVPGSLAPAVVALARERLAFDGLLVTDALVMDAVANHGSVEEAAVQALAAGNDVVMALEAARRVVERLAQALAEGRLAAAVVDAARLRVDAFDVAARRLPAMPASSREPWTREAHAALAAEAAARSLTLVRAEADVLPLAADTRVAVIEVDGTRPSPVEDAAGTSREVGRRLARAFRGGRFVRGAAEAIVDRALDAAAASDVVVVLTRDAFLSFSSRRLLARLSEAGQPVVRIALRNPVDLDLPPRPAVAIAAYADTPVTIDALARALATDAGAAGAGAFPGALPIASGAPEARAAR